MAWRLQLISAMGMDRVIKKRKLPVGLILGIIAIAALAGIFGYQLLVVDNKPFLAARKSEVRIATVIEGDFQEYFQANCYVAPAKTMYVDSRESGMVQSVSADQGDIVTKGQELLRLQNDELELQLRLKKASLESASDNLAECRIRGEQLANKSRRELLEIDHAIDVLKADLAQKEIQYTSNFLPEKEYRQAVKELDYMTEKRGLLVDSQRLEASLLDQEKLRIRKSMEVLSLDFARLEDRVHTLTVTSPAFGQITAFDVSVGELKAAGSRLAQLDIMDKLIMKTTMDEYYLSKITLGNKGSFTCVNRNGKDTRYTATVSWISPDVKSNAFDAELEFDSMPADAHIGQRFLVNVELGEKRKAVMVEQGPFFQTSGGGWVYVVDASGSAAVKRKITVGSTNPDYLEVVAGLAAGEQAVVSDYAGFSNAERITLK
jgi:HlyD family secretion protein